MTNTLRNIHSNLDRSSTKWTGYFDVYERYFSQFIGKAPKVLEIGVLGGGSIEMWQKYFGMDAQIIGLDIDPGCLEYKYEGNVQIALGDQGNPEFWDKFLVDNTGFDIVIDDGGHTMIQQLITLQKVFPHLKHGGVYVVEDTHTSYWKNWGGAYGNPETFLTRAKQMTDIMNQQHFEQPHINEEVLKVFEGLYSVSFFNSMVVFEKKQLEPFIITDNTRIIYRT